MGKKLCKNCKGKGVKSEKTEATVPNGLHDEFGQDTVDHLDQTELVTCDRCFGTGTEPSQRKLMLLEKIKGLTDEKLIKKLLDMVCKD